MKRFIAIILSLLIVGVPGAFWQYREHQAQIQLQRQIRAERHAEWERLVAQAKREKSAILLINSKDDLLDAACSRGAELLVEHRKAHPRWIDLAYWQSQSADIVGYLYSPGTVISYPVIQGSNNEFYLDHDIYGNPDINGCIMLEHLNRSDFSDNNSIIYGHHMKAGTMLASIDRYKNAAFYPDHAYMFLYTPSGTYRLDLIAGYSCPHNDEVFCKELTEKQIARFKEKSTFTTNLEDTSGPYVTLCTCSYEHENWRYVVICKKVPI